MPLPRLPALALAAVVGVPALAQPPPPPAANETIGPPSILQPIRPIIDPLVRPLGSPDEPFRPFAPLGPPPALADEGIGTRFGLGVLAGRYGIPGYGVTWMPSQPVTGQATNFGLVRQDLSLFAPVYRDGSDTAAVGLGIRNELYQTDAVLPDSHRPFPSTLWDIEAGVSYSHQWENGWATGAVVSVGSASNLPFSRSDVLVASLAAYTTFPVAGQDAWILGLSYSPTSDFPYPLPIAAYYWRPSPDLEVTMGFPVFVRWQMTPTVNFEGLYIPLRTVSARFTWGPCDLPDTRFYAAFNWANESFFLADRPDPGLRLYGFEKRLTGGMQINLPYQLRLDLSAGYVFDRFYFQGKQYSDRNNDRIDVGSGFFAAFQLRLQF